MGLTLDVEACRRAIRDKNDALRAVLTVLDEPVFDEDARRTGPLAGVPYVLKDTWDTAGVRTTGGSWRHRARVPAESARPYKALLASGAVLLGKSNLCDLAFSAESDNHLFGPVRHPMDPTRTAGGSTGGGAAAVASGMAAFDWGTDFGGSIRMPAAHCGIVGLRLSSFAWPVEYDHFPRISPHFWSFCGMGPLTRSVADARRVVRALRSLRNDAAVVDVARDHALLYAPDRAHRGDWPDFVRDATALLLRAAVRAEPAAMAPPEDVRGLFASYLASHFEEFIEGDELSLREGIPAILMALASGGRLDRRVHPNTAILFALLAAGRLVFRDKARANDALAALRAQMASAWRRALVVAPATTALPPRHGRAALALRMGTFCQLGNLTDATSIVIPFGSFAPSGLPRALQVLGPPGSEEAVLDLAERLERAATLSSA